MFKELAVADSLRMNQIIENNWIAFDLLGAAFAKDKNEDAVFGLFSTFMLAASPESNPLEYNSANILTKVEYFGNLLTSVSDGGVLVVGGLENYRLARYAQVILGKGPTIAIVELDLLKCFKFRKYLKRTYSIAIPDDLQICIAENQHPTVLYEALIDWLLSESGRDVYFGMDFPIFPTKKSYLIGPGRLYSENLDKETQKRLFLELYGQKYSFEHAENNWDRLSESTNDMVQTYSEGTLFIASNWILEGDTASAESLAIIAKNRLPRHWQSMVLYLTLFKDIPEDSVRAIVAEVQRFVDRYPKSRRAKEALKEFNQN